MIHSRLFQQLVYWGVWLVIPLIWEILVGFASAAIVVFRFFTRRTDPELDFFPKVSILIPVYNSRGTLEVCLNSILEQNYPIESLEIFLIDNGSKDDSYSIFTAFQAKHPELRIWWYTSGQGKSKALNKGIFASTGKYIINIDSDGRFDKSAVRNIVRRFEANKEISCLTGNVLIDHDLVEKTPGAILKIIRLCEMFEYYESFLVGRNIQSIFNTMYTIAGAFSCFRREVILKTQMYNSETLGEDTHMTFQIKNIVGAKVHLCEDAFFFVDPIESFDRIYTQRQRWQRAELEVASLYTTQHLGGIIDFVKKPPFRKLVSDHTLVFPRLIWFFGMFYLYFINYPLNLIIGANLFLYVAYLFNGYIYFLTSLLYLKEQPEIRKHAVANWYIPVVLPVFRFIVFWVRVAGIINSLKTDSRWQSKTLSEEVGIVREKVKSEVNVWTSFISKIEKKINRE